jgi:hypothetical protein
MIYKLLKDIWVTVNQNYSGAERPELILLKAGMVLHCNTVLFSNRVYVQTDSGYELWFHIHTLKGNPEYFEMVEA